MTLLGKYFHWFGMAILVAMAAFFTVGYFTQTDIIQANCTQSYLDNKIKETRADVNTYVENKEAFQPDYQIYVIQKDSLVYWNNVLAESPGIKFKIDTSYNFVINENLYYYHQETMHDHYSWVAIYPVYVEGKYYAANIVKPQCFMAGKILIDKELEPDDKPYAVKIHPIWIWIYVILCLFISISFVHFFTAGNQRIKPKMKLTRERLFILFLLVLFIPTLFHPFFNSYWFTSGLGNSREFSFNPLYLLTILSGIIIFINLITPIKIRKNELASTGVLTKWAIGPLAYLLIAIVAFLSIYLIHSIILISANDLNLEELYRIKMYDLTMLVIYLLIFSIFFSLSLGIFNKIHGNQLTLPQKLVGILSGLSVLIITVWISPLSLKLIPLGLAYLIFVILLDLYQDRRSLNSTWAFTWMILISAFLSFLVFGIDQEMDIRNNVARIKGIISERDFSLEAALEENAPERQENYAMHIMSFDNPQLSTWKNNMIEVGQNIHFNPLSGAYLYIQKNNATILLPAFGYSPEKKNWLQNENYELYQQDKIIISHGNLKNKEGHRFENLKKDLDYSISDGNIKYYYKGHSDLVLVQIVEFPGLLRPLSLFSLYFFILSIILFSLSILNRFIKFIPDHLDLKLFQKNSLRSRIQVSIISLLITSFFIIGLVSNYYLGTLAMESNRGLQLEHADNIITQLEQNLKDQEQKELTGSLELEVFKHFQNGSDRIYLYDKNGHQFNFQSCIGNKDDQLVTVPHDIYKRLISEDPPKVFYYQNINDQGVYFNISGGTTEEIFGFIQGKPMISGSKKISDIFATFLSIYTLLFILSGFIAIGLSNSITRPIELLGKKLKSLKLSKKNEPVQWKNEDEIGALISIYNEMIQKLSENAKVMAKVERDSAWKEMAKQVAHEIKNPLTPLKLNIQYLETKIRMNPEDAHELISQITPGLIEQIDNLSQIASEFSNFAQLPIARNEKLRLNEIVKTVHDFFRKREDLQFQLFVPINDILVFADRNHLVRILNNVVKNAIQAIPPERDGVITLRLYKKANDAIIQVSDNGSGIPPDMQDKVFSPNFTTKSSGTGLGLAISLNMLESFNGRIYFETEEDNGTDFFIEIPLMRLEDNYAGENKVFLDD